MKNIILFLAFPSLALANMGPQGFGAFLNYYFVETGTFTGDGCLKALSAGFKEVRSIERDRIFFLNAKKRLSGFSNIHLFLGNSSHELLNIIKDIEKPITFWLDAHIYPPRADSGPNCPLLEELAQIRQHPIKRHIILIDDMHCTNTAAFDFLSKEDIIKAILEINPNYHISYIDGGDKGEYKNNIMVATVD